MKSYGKEVIIDIHECKNTHLFNRKDLKRFFIELCDFINMKRCDLYFWDYVGFEEEYKKAPVHLKGTSAIQFISTSNITLHTLDVLKIVYLNIFSCKNFNTKDAKEFCRNYFDGKIVNSKVVKRI